MLTNFQNTVDTPIKSVYYSKHGTVPYDLVRRISDESGEQEWIV